MGMKSNRPIESPEHVGMDFDVAVACGYVPDRPVSKFKKWWNRLRLWFFPSHPPCAKIMVIPDDAPDPRPDGPSQLREQVASHGISTTAALYKTLAEIDRVLNQSAGDCQKYWKDYDAANPHLNLRQPHPTAGIVPKPGETGTLKVYMRTGRRGTTFYSIGREEDGQRRYWVGLGLTFIDDLLGTSNAIWETLDLDVAIKELERIAHKDMFIAAAEKSVDELRPEVAEDFELIGFSVVKDPLPGYELHSGPVAEQPSAEQPEIDPNLSRVFDEAGFPKAVVESIKPPQPGK